MTTMTSRKLIQLLFCVIASLDALPHKNTKNSFTSNFKVSHSSLLSTASPVNFAEQTWEWRNTKDLDAKILKIAAPAVLNFAIIPLVGAVDTYWVGRMRNALALAGQGAANQVFSSAFWIISFLPNIVTPLVAKAAGEGNNEAIQDRVGEAIFIATLMGVVGMALLTYLPNWALSSVLASDHPARAFAEP